MHASSSYSHRRTRGSHISLTDGLTELSIRHMKRSIGVDIVGSTFHYFKRPSIAAVRPTGDHMPAKSHDNESAGVVCQAQTRKRQARAKTFESQLKLTWIQCFGVVLSLILVCSDVPRSGFGVNKHLIKYPTLEPDVFNFFGPWHYVMLNTSREAARTTQTPVWGYKQDTTSVGLRAFADFFKLTTFPDCNTYRGPCASPLMSQEIVFEMLDSLVNATALIKKPLSKNSPARQVAEPRFATVRSSNLYLDRLHHFLLHQLFTNPLWRTSQILYYAPELLFHPEQLSATKNVCSDFGQAVPGFCHQFWSNFHYSCPATDPDGRAVGRIWDHTMERVRQAQQMYPGLQVDLTLLESHEDLQLNKGSVSSTGMRRDDLVTIVRARQCNVDEHDARNCSTIFISEYRYEIGIVYSDALQWYHIVSWLRGVGQGYYYLRIGMLLKFCFNLVSDDVGEGARPKQSLRERIAKSCVLLLKLPVQAIIFGSPLPILCYACAHIIDSAITYEVIANIFTSQNGLFQLTFWDLCTVGVNQMRSVWILALALHVVVQLRATTQRKKRWQPIDGIQGVSEYLLSSLASVTMLAQIRVKSLRDARIMSVFKIIDLPKLQAIKYQDNLGHDDFSHVALGGVLIDVKFFAFMIALLYVAVSVHSLRTYYSRFSPYKVRASPLQTKTPVSYAAGALWPVGAMCIHWSSDYFFVTLPSPQMDDSSATPVKTTARTTTWLARVQTNLPAFAMSTSTFQYIQLRMASLHDRDDGVDSSIAIMNLVAMSDPFVYYCYLKGGNGQRLGYYQSRRNPNNVFLLPCEVVDAPSHHLDDLELLWTVRSSDLSFADLIHCG